MQRKRARVSQPPIETQSVVSPLSPISLGIRSTVTDSGGVLLPITALSAREASPKRAEVDLTTSEVPSVPQEERPVIPSMSGFAPRLVPPMHYLALVSFPLTCHPREGDSLQAPETSQHTNENVEEGPSVVQGGEPAANETFE
ncbi:hypothetical protein AMTR_s00070p00111860 [Amborella trichopoda]|uniref:Uncharacterized protein n=1 Tax=Amborella trichopoda TaxID=13333 RepID=U5DEI0_AMBTC|nr:hypothetical protein AMTR_s00070p00111860 [Amborella trichopoda]